MQRAADVKGELWAHRSGLSAQTTLSRSPEGAGLASSYTTNHLIRAEKKLQKAAAEREQELLSALE